MPGDEFAGLCAGQVALLVAVELLLGQPDALGRVPRDVPLVDRERARDLLLRLRQAADAGPADELYATHRLIDLYLGRPEDAGRAMVELRRMADRFPDTPDGQGALAELRRRRLQLAQEHEQT